MPIASTMDVKTVEFKPFQDQKPGTYVAPSPLQAQSAPVPPPPSRDSPNLLLGDN